MKNKFLSLVVGSLLFGHVFAQNNNLAKKQYYDNLLQSKEAA